MPIVKRFRGGSLGDVSENEIRRALRRLLRLRIDADAPAQEIARKLVLALAAKPN